MRRETRIKKTIIILLFLIFFLPGKMLIIASEVPVITPGDIQQGPKGTAGSDWHPVSLVSVKSQGIISVRSIHPDDVMLTAFPKTIITVFDFNRYGKWHSNDKIGPVVAGRLMTVLSADRRLEIIHQRAINKTIKNQGYTLFGTGCSPNAIEQLKMAGVDYLISGSVIKYQDTIEINAWITNVESASIVTLEQVKGKNDTPPEKLIDEINKKIIKNFPPKKYIVNRNGSEVTIDIGSYDEIKPSMYYAVFEKHELINGDFDERRVDTKKKMVGIIRVEKVQKKIATAKIVYETYPGAVTNGQTVMRTGSVTGTNLT